MTDQLTVNQRSAIARAKRTPELQRILFAEARGAKWLMPFKDAGFLDPLGIPEPIPSKQKGYLNIPPWPITDYLVAVSPELRLAKNEECARAVMQFIRDSTTYAKQKQFSNHRVWLSFSKILSQLPPSLVVQDDLVAVDFWLDDRYDRGITAEILGEQWLVSLMESGEEHGRQLALGLLKALYAFKVQVRERRSDLTKEISLRFDSWYAKNLTKKVAEKTGFLLGLSAVSFFQQCVERAIAELGRDGWSAVWRPSIGDHEQNHSASDGEDILIEAYRDALLGYVDAVGQSATVHVDLILKSPLETTRRIALYAIDQRFAILGQSAERIGDPALFTNNCRHELWHLLNNHFNELSEITQSRVLEIIAGIVYASEEDADSSRRTAYAKLIWLSAVERFQGQAREMYLAAAAVAGVTPEHPDFASYMSSGWVTPESPIPKEELQALEIPMLVQRLKNYEPRDGIGEPSIEGLLKTLREIIKADPLRYSENLSAFETLPLAFVDEVIEGYSDLLTAKAALPWESLWPALVGFCELIGLQSRLWNDPASSANRGPFIGNGRWIVGSIGRLIESGAHRGDCAMPIALMGRCTELLRFILEREPGASFKDSSDPVTVAINSARGRCVGAFVIVATYACSDASDRKESVEAIWKQFEPEFDAQLDWADRGVFEFIPLWIVHLQNFLFMSREWTIENFDRVVDKKNDLKWLFAMQSFAHLATVFQPIYAKFRNEGHFKSALEDDRLKKDARDRIVQHIAVSYLHGDESLTDPASLINLVLDRGAQEELSQLIWFLWTQRDADPSVKNLVMQLWPRLLARVNTATDGGRELIARLSDWGDFVTIVDENSEPLLRAVAPYAGEGHHSWDFLRTIDRISLQQPTKAFELWALTLESGTPTYPEEALLSAIGNIGRSKPSGLQQAKEIIGHYLRAGAIDIAREMTLRINPGANATPGR